MPVDQNTAIFSLCNMSETASEGNVLQTQEAMLPDNNAKTENLELRSEPLSKSMINRPPNPILKDYDSDIGYISHDTQDDNSQKSHLSVNITDWHQLESDEQMSGADELDDLLYHFNNFFKEKLETELQTFETSMRGMLHEQQIHVRQIVHSTAGDQGVTDSPVNPMDTADNTDIYSSSSPDELDLSMTSSQVVQEERSNHLLTELLSLSCAITSLLHQDKYRT